jgi:hypothetical protein
MILTTLLLYRIRKLSCKFEVFWSSGSGKEDFKNILPISTHMKPNSHTVPHLTRGGYDTQDHVLRMRAFQNEANYSQKS